MSSTMLQKFQTYKSDSKVFFLLKNYRKNMLKRPISLFHYILFMMSTLLVCFAASTMVLKQDQQRVKTLLTDAIVSTLSRNGLLYKSEFCIEGLLGVTLDNHDVFLINIKETIRSANLTGCSPPSKDPSLAPLDLMVFNSLGPGLGDVQTTHGEDLTMKNASLTSTPGKKSSSFCPYLDTGADMCVKGDTSFNFALNYADYDVIEDLSRAGCGKRIQNLTMDDLSMLDNDMGIIMEKDVLPTVSTVPPLERKCADKVSTMKAAGLGKDFDTENQAETLDLSVQEDDVLPTITSKPATPETEEGMPLNLSEPKKKKTNKVCRKKPGLLLFQDSS